MLKIAWCKADKLFGAYKQELHGVWKNKRRPPPAVLPKKLQKLGDIPRGDCYCRFQFTSDRKIPIDVVLWIKEHTALVEDWSGEMEE
jgi:hypothetical protein